MALKHASEELRNNHEFIMAAVSQNPWTLEHASDELKTNHEIVMAAVAENPWTLQHASEELKNNHKILVAAVSKEHWFLQHVPEELLNNHEFVIAVVSNDPANLPFAFEELRGNSDIVVSKELRVNLQSYRCYPLVALNVVLLSGRCASILFSVRSSLHAILSECADHLGLDPRQVTATGVLLSGSTTIHSLNELEPWQVHNLTLVLG